MKIHIVLIILAIAITACSTPEPVEEQQENLNAPTQEEIEQDEEEFRSDLEESLRELEELENL